MVNDELLGQIEQMAGDDNWRVREAAASQIRDLNEKYFDDYYATWQDWVRSENHFLRRAVEIGLAELAPQFYDRAWALIEPLLYDENTYVRKSCGPVALSAIANLNPEESFKRFMQLIREQQNRNVRWNIAGTLGSGFGLAHSRRALEVLHELAHDQRRFVWRAASAALVRLLRRYPELRDEILGWEDIKPALAVVKEYTVWPEGG